MCTRITGQAAVDVKVAMSCPAKIDLLRCKKAPPKSRWNEQQYTVAHNSFIYGHKRVIYTYSLQCTEATQLDLQQI